MNDADRKLLEAWRELKSSGWKPPAPPRTWQDTLADFILVALVIGLIAFLVVVGGKP